jgi:acyl-CoA thioesterase-2
MSFNVTASGNSADDSATDSATYTVEDGQQRVDDLVALLDLEQIEEDIFRGRSPEVSMQRVFGGQVAGQALVAAGRTVEPGRAVHSLHSYFIRPGDPSVPIVYTVDRIRDGRSFTTRRVAAVQHGKAIFSLSASFQLPQTGIDHQSPMPASPPPELLTGYHREAEHEAPHRYVSWPFEVRPVPAAADDGAHPEIAGTYLFWTKGTGKLPDDPLLHTCALTYASDLTQLNTILVHHGLHIDTNTRLASLDHALWFHRPFRADEWLLYAQESPSASGGRGLSIGRIFAQDGSHVATVVQEGMIRIGGH